MYITTRFADVPQVHFVAGPGGARTQLTFLPERVGTVAPRPGHDQFLYTMDEGGAENNQLFLQDKAGGEPRRITDGKSRNIGAEMVAVGRTCSLEQQCPQWPRHGSVRRRARRPAFRPIVQGSLGAMGPSPTGRPTRRKIAAVEYISINESYIHIIEIATGKTETITPAP